MMNSTLMILLISGVLLGLIVLAVAVVLIVLEQRRSRTDADDGEQAPLSDADEFSAEGAEFDEMGDDLPGDAADDNADDASAIETELVAAIALDDARLATTPPDDVPLQLLSAPSANAMIDREPVTPDPIAEPMPPSVVTSGVQAVAVQPPRSGTSSMPVAPTPPVTAGPPTGGVMQEALRVFRGMNGELLVQMNNALYFSPSAVTDASTRAEIETLVAELQRWLSQTDAPAVAGDSTGVTVPPPPISPPVTLSRTAANDDPNVVKLSAREAAQRPLTAPSWSIGKQITQLARRNTSPKIEIKTIADEINDHLQQHIAGTAWMARGLRIIEAADGTLRFVLDGVEYDRIEAVPDGDVQGHIRAAIRAWEQQQ